jgi:hypothetical protein
MDLKYTFGWVIATGALWVCFQANLAQTFTARTNSTGNVSFDVVSIKQNMSGRGFALDYTPDGFTATFPNAKG